MKGYIKIEASTYEGKEGLRVQTEMAEVTYMDRIHVVHSVCHALRVTPSELKLLAGLMSSGLVDEMLDVKGLHDETEAADSEGSCNKNKKPNVHIIGGDAEDMLELLKDLLS